MNLRVPAAENLILVTVAEEYMMTILRGIQRTRGKQNEFGW